MVYSILFFKTFPRTVFYSYIVVSFTEIEQLSVSFNICSFQEFKLQQKNPNCLPIAKIVSLL